MRRAAKRDAIEPDQPTDRYYRGDNGSETCWRQCRYCGGYAEGPRGTRPSKHQGVCPVAELEKGKT